MLWLLRGIVVGVAAGVGYLAGSRRGAKQVAEQLMTDKDLGRQVLEKLASLHGAKLSMFEATQPAPPKE